ncbi:MAG TPA: hypothetical protein VD794_00770 [Flavisolibacter sp.]|nr:hypothetical protein [Flavisolibacter sp.]
MKKVTLAVNTFLLCILITVFTGCLKDSCKNTYSIYTPIYQTLTEVRIAMKSTTPQALKQTGKLYVYDNYIFLNEVDKGIHVIDNTNPSAPRNISFIPIPGNVDLAVKGNYLYADSYSDIVVFDISTPTQVTARKFINNVFPLRSSFYWNNTSNPDSIQVLVGYSQRDTTVDCETYRAWNNCPNCMYATADGARFYTTRPTGIGGSMARFSVVNNYLYAVSNSELYSFNITDASNPNKTSQKQLDPWFIETIYPFQDKLFIGSNNGMLIYDIANPASPSYISQFGHVRSCDPVITDGQHAYVTLRSGTQCQGFTNQLEVLNVNDLAQPRLVKTYSMTNPHGLSKDGNLLFICDGKDGLKVYDATDVNQLKQIAQIGGLETYDVILQNRIAIVVAKDGLYQYDYSEKNNIILLSKISINK